MPGIPPPPPVVSRNFKNLHGGPNKDGRTVKGEGRIGSYIVEKRSGGEDSRSAGRGEDTISEGSNKGGSRFALNDKSFGLRDGLKSDRYNARDSSDNRSANNRQANQRIGRRKSSSESAHKKDNTLRFSALHDKRNGNSGVSQGTKRVINSGRLVLEASYDELPECFHIGHNPEFFYPPEIRRAIHNVQFIHSHMVQQDKFDEVRRS